jgi:hypothetical protein
VHHGLGVGNIDAGFIEFFLRRLVHVEVDIPEIPGLDPGPEDQVNARVGQFADRDGGLLTDFGLSQKGQLGFPSD